jgi:opacity protein-like surface antigen
MKKSLLLFSFFFVAVGLLAQEPENPPASETEKPEKPEAGPPSAEERISALEEEIEKQKHGKAIRVYQSMGGMGPAASQVYHGAEGVSIGGYGEINYNAFRSNRKTDQMDVLRFILYTGYRFNDWIFLNAELEYEHAGFEEQSVVTDATLSGTTLTTTKRDINQGAVFVEFAYVDFKFADPFQLKLGLNLVPMGLTNYLHEPTTFYSVNRPYTEQNIIPTTWREIGAIVTGDLLDKRVTYRTGILNGQRGKNFSDTTWMRGGRTKGSKVRAEDFAYVANVDVRPLEALLAGVSYYRGNAGQDEIAPVTWKDRVVPPTPGAAGTNSLFTGYASTLKADTSANVRVQMAEAHYMFEKGAFTTRGLFARGWLNEEGARALNRQTNKNIAREVEGGYVEAGVNVLHFFGLQKKLVVFVREEYVNTQRRTIERYPGGKEDLDDLVCTILNCRTTSQLTNTNRALGIVTNSDAAKELYGVRGVPDRSQDRRIYTVGMAFFPHENVTLKLDYEMHHSKSDYHKDIEQLNASNNKIDQINFGLGFIF